MDKLDVFELDADTTIQTTIAELQRIYHIGWQDGEKHATLTAQDRVDDYDDGDVIVIGDIV